MKEKETALIIQLAKNFIEETIKLEPQFESAFFRFYVEDRLHESCSLYTIPNDVFIVSAFDRHEFFDLMDGICLELMQEIGKLPSLLLLTIDKNFDYKIQFEYENM